MQYSDLIIDMLEGRKREEGLAVLYVNHVANVTVGIDDRSFFLQMTLRSTGQLYWTPLLSSYLCSRRPSHLDESCFTNITLCGVLPSYLTD